VVDWLPESEASYYIALRDRWSLEMSPDDAVMLRKALSTASDKASALAEALVRVDPNPSSVSSDRNLALDDAGLAGQVDLG
jgi:hypothetical protein